MKRRRPDLTPWRLEFTTMNPTTTEPQMNKPSVRCKMVCTGVTPQDGDGRRESARVTFHTQYDPSIDEDKRFTTATPDGSATFLINAPAAVSFFKVGQAYYFDAVECPSPAVNMNAPEAAEKADPPKPPKK